MRVLVTGHKGYIGTVMVPMLQAAGHSVLGLDTDFYRDSVYGEIPAPVDEIIKDVRDIQAGDLAGVEAVVHLAALSNDMLGELDPDITTEINHRASVRLAELCRDRGVSRFVFASSCSMYGASGEDSQSIPILDETADFNPVTAYATSKVLVERDVSAMATDNFSPTFMRNATAYGASPKNRFDLVVNNLTAWAFTTGKVQMKSDGSPWRPLVHIQDISQAVIAVLDSARDKVHNEAFNVGRNDENFQIRTVAETVRSVVPDCELSFAEGAGPDLRNYRVCFDKYEQTFPEHPLKWSLESGVREIYQQYLSNGLGKDEYEGPRYKRIAQLQQLLDSGRLDRSLKWSNTSSQQASPEQDSSEQAES